MLKDNTIERKSGPLEESSFESLRKEGLELLQKLSGENWTDYNVHDPGITVLEQVCFALTDLFYRTDFEVADILASLDGKIDFERCGLFKPESIFPSAPISASDYRKIFFDAVPELDNVWIEPVLGSNLAGLYCVDISLTEEAKARGKAEVDRIKNKIRNLFAENRNLGEDLEEIRVVRPTRYTLHGTIESNGKRNASEILAEIYWAASRYVSPGIDFHSFQQLQDEGTSLSDLYSGPLTNHVYLEDENRDREVAPITISRLSGIIGEIEGVTRVAQLHFEHGTEKSQYIEYKPPLRVPSLEFPGSDEEFGVQLVHNERSIRISQVETRSQFDLRQSEHRSLRRTKPRSDDAASLPQGESRNLTEYFSMQTNFPANYGISKNGVPDSASPRRKAQARQLKAYLLFFEQIMANYLENLDGISRLFSLDAQLGQSYWHHDLSEEEVPNIEELYVGGTNSASQEIAGIVSRYDNYFDRRGRVLDYLLAIYGESFDQSALRQFNSYYSEQELAEEGIRNKLNLLKLVGSSI